MDALAGIIQWVPVGLHQVPAYSWSFRVLTVPQTGIWSERQGWWYHCTNTQDSWIYTFFPGKVALHPFFCWWSTCPVAERNWYFHQGQKALRCYPGLTLLLFYTFSGRLLIHQYFRQRRISFFHPPPSLSGKECSTLSDYFEVYPGSKWGRHWNTCLNSH